MSVNSPMTTGNQVAVGMIVLLLALNFHQGTKAFRNKEPDVTTNKIEPNRDASVDDNSLSIQIDTMTQAESLLQSVNAGLQQARQFPFQPQWSHETYDPNVPLDAALLERLKKHVELRNFYSSKARLTPEFKALTHLLTEYTIEINPILVRDLYMCLEGIASPNPVEKENPELAIPSVHEDFHKFHNELSISMRQVAQNLLQVEDNRFWSDFFQIRPNVAFFAPDTRIKPGEHLLIQ